MNDFDKQIFPSFGSVIPLMLGAIIVIIGAFIPPVFMKLSLVIKTGTLVFINIPEDNSSEIKKIEDLLCQRALNLIENMNLKNYLKVTSVLSNATDSQENKRLFCSEFFKPIFH